MRGMIKLDAVIVCVDFSDVLSLTLPYNRHHFRDVLVVTCNEDATSWLVAREHAADTFVTDAFYETGAIFNKYKALEEALDYFGRDRWLCLMDVDIAWPVSVPETVYENGFLYGPKRRVIEDLPDHIPEESDWQRYPVYLPSCPLFGGFTQIFHGSDEHLGDPPWHEMNWRHGAGGDTSFQNKWPKQNKVVLPFEVLHLGPIGYNWCGRAVPYLDGRENDKIDERLKVLTKFTKRPGSPRRSNLDKY